MKRVIMFILFSAVIFMANISVYAQANGSDAPTVQYKLIDHDKIALRWDAVEGADGYYIYRTDVKTGKTFRYPSVVNKTENTIGRLSPDTEYIFSVAPIKKNVDKVTVGKRSSGTKLTTPKEWYYYNEFSIDYNNKKIKSDFYKTDYKKSKKEAINLGDIRFVDEIIYYDDWYYIIGYYDAIKKCNIDPWSSKFDFNRKCVARIKEDGTQKEILFDDLYQGEDILYNYQVTDDAIYIRSCHKSYDEDVDSDGNYIKRYYYDPKYCWLKNIFFKTGEVKTLVPSCYINWFYYYDGYIYYEYDNSRTLQNGFADHPIFVLDCYDYQTNERLSPKDDEYYYYKIDDNGKINHLLSKHNGEINIFGNDVFISNDILVFTYNFDIYTASKESISHKKKIYEQNNTNWIHDIKVLNGYIYFCEDIDTDNSDEYRYCRIKTDGTGLEKQNKPFEWYY